MSAALAALRRPCLCRRGHNFSFAARARYLPGFKAPELWKPYDSNELGQKRSSGRLNPVGALKTTQPIENKTIPEFRSFESGGAGDGGFEPCSADL